MKPNIFQYSDFRKYLVDFYNYAKKNNPAFSHRYFAAKAGFASSNFLHLVMTGKRNLTKEFMPKFAKAIGLNKKEQHYFESLISFNQAKDPESKRYYLELIHTLKKDKAGTLLKDEQFEYISNWYYPVIRELVSLPHFNEDPFWIKKELGNKVTARQIKRAVEKMVKLGLLGRDENGRLLQTDTHLITEDDIHNAAVYTFHQQMLSLAKEMLVTVDGKKREISGITLAVSEKQFAEMKRMIHDFENAILSYMNDNPDMPESVFQLNVQFFPITGLENKNTNKNGGHRV